MIFKKEIFREKTSKTIKPNYETILNFEALKGQLESDEKKSEILDLEIKRLRKQNQELNLELMSLTNKLSIFSEKKLKRKQKVSRAIINFKMILFFLGTRNLIPF